MLEERERSSTRPLSVHVKKTSVSRMRFLTPLCTFDSEPVRGMAQWIGRRLNLRIR